MLNKKYSPWNQGINIATIAAADAISTHMLSAVLPAAIPSALALRSGSGFGCGTGGSSACDEGSGFTGGFGQGSSDFGIERCSTGGGGSLAGGDFHSGGNRF